MNPTAWDRIVSPYTVTPRNRADRRRAQQAAKRTARQKARECARIERATNELEKETTA